MPGVMRVFLHLAISLTALATIPVVADETLDEPGVTVVALGDSITKGERTGVKAEETFAALVEAGLKDRGIRARVINVGSGGERTDGALARLEKDVLARKPAIVAIMYGTNDSYVDKEKTEPRLTVEQYRANLKAILAKLKSAGVQPVLMTAPRWGPEGRNGLGANPNVLLEKYMEACQSVAREGKIPLVDHFAHWTKAEAEGTKIADWTTDQCHPNPAGHQVMAELIVPVVAKAARGK